MKTFLLARKKLLIGVIFALILLSVWVWFAGNARQQASFRRTDDRVSQAKRLIPTIIEGSRTKRLTSLRVLAGLKKDDTCKGDWWNDWQQTVLPNAKTGAEQCRAKEKKLAKVAQAAADINDYLTDESKVTKQIGTLKVDASASDWPARAKTAAESAAKAINSIRVVSSVKPVQAAAKARTEAIITAWNALDTASKKQDKTAYQTAEAQLKQSYADLAAIIDVSDDALQKLFSTLTTATDTL